MKRIIFLILIGIFIFSFALSSFAEKIKVVATYPYIASIAKEIGKEFIETAPLARGDYNPHTIIPKPSYIAKIRNADVLIINGAQLEIGWLSSLLNQANNPALMPGKPGFLDLSVHAQLIDIPKSVSREHGDIHPDGNPHFYLDPHNIPMLAKAISNKLSSIDPKNSGNYKNNLDDFLARWNTRLKFWDIEFGKYKNIKVIQYHKLFDYIIHRYDLVLTGTIEPLPGIPPSAKHMANIAEIIKANKITFILQDVYNPKDAGEHLSLKYSIKHVTLPHDVYSVKEANDIFSLFDEIVRRLAK